MKDEPSQRRRPTSPPPRTPDSPPTSGWSLRLSYGVRQRFRRGADWILGTDAVWSVAFVVVVVALLGSPWLGPAADSLFAGQRAPRDIKAVEAFEHIDLGLTEARRAQVLDQIPNVYVHDADRGAHLVGQLASVFQQGRGVLEEGREALEQVLGDVPPAALRVLHRQRFDPAVERELTGVLGQVMTGKVVGTKALLERESVITLVRRPGSPGSRVGRFDEFIDLLDARKRVREGVGQTLDLPRDDEHALGELAASFVDLNVYYDQETTRRERQEAARTVQPVFTRVPRGALLVRKGQLLTAEDLETIKAATASSRPFGPRVLFGLLLIASMLAFFLFRYTRYHQRAFRKLRHLHALLVLMLLSMLVLSRAMLWMTRKVADSLQEPFNHLDVYPYLIPVGAGTILVALLANGRIATAYAAFVSLLFGATTRWDPYLMVWAMIVQCAGVYAISTYRERAALLRAGLVVGTAGATAAIAFETLKGSLWPVSHTTHTTYAAALAFTGGAVGVGLLVSFALPIFERLFNVLTDIRLLELSNVNNPLLSELAVKAPGSYNHSLVVGTLAEEAARAIDANSLFCRVAAFYHDIGKINKAEYFVENQRGHNPHDRLAPSMSALIIASHVKDGIKMAREAGLPEQIVDIIPQHHGTKLMTFFYEKAKNTTDPSLGPVQEEDFRYPGPKPQTREAAIFMLADAVEAAARTVEEPTANRLKEMIRKLTSSIVVSGELDSCDLTFADLERIQAAFLRCLVGMYHHRVDYPGFDFSHPKLDSRAALKSDSKSPGEFRDRKIARSG